MVGGFFLACPPETSCKALNKQVSLESPLGITRVCHLVTTPELRSEHNTFYSLLTRVLFMPSVPKWENAVCLGTLRTALSAKKAFSKKDMFRAFSFCFTLHITLLSMTCSIMFCSVMQEDKCSKVFTV